jgi:alpha-1,2-mannosyltransferase
MSYDVNERQAMSVYASGMLMRRLVLFLALNALVLNGILWAVSPVGFKDTVLRHTWDFVHGRSGDDSWSTMSVAYLYVQKPHATPLYTEVFFHRKVKFQYPPPALFAFAAMRQAGIERVRVSDDYFGPWPSINDGLAWLFVLVMTLSVAALLHLQFKHGTYSSQNRSSFALLTVIAAGFTLTFYPIMKACTLGQIQVWLDALFALSLLMWMMGRKTLSGFLIGLVCLVKPHFGLFLIWALVRREWRFIACCSATICIGLAASIATFGWADHIDYLRALSYMAQHGEAYYPNQSINGLLNRLMSVSEPKHYNNLTFDIEKFAPFNPWIYGATVISSSLILLAAIARRREAEDRIVDFCRMAVSLTVAAPIAWEHHYGILLPIFAIMLPRTIHYYSRMIWLMVSYVLVSNFISATNLLASTFLNVGQSYLLAGAFILLALLYVQSTATPIAIHSERTSQRA